MPKVGYTSIYNFLNRNEQDGRLEILTKKNKEQRKMEL